MSYISAIVPVDLPNIVFVWERNSKQERVLIEHSAPYYFYVDDPKGKYRTMYNTPVSKVDCGDNRGLYYSKRKELRDQGKTIWESDISPDLRVLSNKYFEQPAPKLHITFLDIENDYNRELGYSGPKNPYAPINAISLFHEHRNEMVSLSVPPDDGIEWTNELLETAVNDCLPLPNHEYKTKFIVCKDERMLLEYFLMEIEDSDVLTGWNCIPINQSVWTNDKIVSINKLHTTKLHDSTIVNTSSVVTKPIWNITLANGYTIQSSGQHRFLITSCSPNKYINFTNNKCLTYEELTPENMTLHTNCMFAELKLRTNNQPRNCKFTDDQLYLAGLIYTDGTLCTKNNVSSGFRIFQSDKELLESLPLVETAIVGPHKQCYSRGVKYSLIADATQLIYDDLGNKRLNIEELSTLSYTQFMSFLSGLLDGDGYIHSNTIEWCNFNGDIEVLFELCLWNGIFSTIQKNVLRLSHFNYDDLSLKKISRWGTFRPTNTKRPSRQKANQTKYNIKNDVVYVKISKVEETNKLTQMMDIETDTHHYYTRGVKTHNSEKFDFPFIGKRIEITLGKHRLKDMCFPGANPPAWVDVVEQNKFKSPDPNAAPKTFIRLDISGRMLADYMILYKKYEASEKPSYKLATISEDVLVDEDDNPLLPKLEYEGSLYDLYRKDFAFFVRYNIRDSEILHGFEKKLAYVELANQMYHLSCGQFTHVSGTLKLAELAIINYCHHILKKVVNNNMEPPIDKAIEGALVLLPQIGMHRLLGSIDINSLYPTAIRSINISPEKIRGQFLEEEKACLAIAKGLDTLLTLVLEKTGEYVEATADEWRSFLWEKKWAVSGYGTVFDQDEMGIIPAVLTDWFAQRKRYQALKTEAKNKHDYELTAYYDRLQYVYKIKLNSLYGALSNLHFRFYDLRMGESTTGTGRMILRHQCRKVNEVLDGTYDVDFPTYLTMEKAAEKHHSPDVALDGPIFNGQFQSKSVIYGDSVTGDTNIDILTDTAHRIRIDQLFKQVDYTNGEKEYCNISNIKALTYDKQHNKTRYKKIKYVMRHKCAKQLYRVWITNSQWIDVTEDHSLVGYVNSSKQKKYKDYIAEVKPSELGRDIKSLIYVKHKPQHAYQSIFTLPQSLYELMGYVLGDGYVDTTPTGGVLLSVGKEHISQVEQHILIPLQQEGWISSWTVKPNKHDIQISSVKLRKFLRNELYQNNIKTIPNWIQHEHPVNISSFLRGWFSADGFINKNYTVGLCSINEGHIKIAQEMLFKLGISSTYFTETTQNSFKGKSSGTYTKRLTIKSTSTFKELIGFIPRNKHERLSLYKEGAIKKSMSKYDFEIVNPIKIEKLPIIDNYVYDIEVEDTHTFFANNILVHNTDSTYFLTDTDNIDDAIFIADAVAGEVNKSYQTFMRNTFLCQPEFDNLVKCAREVVSDNGIFVEKKRYMLHLVDLDGERVDKCKVMGLDTKKTTLPSAVSKKLNKFIERYLKGETWEEISVSIVDYKNQLEQTDDIMEIGLPKGVNNVEGYTTNYSLDRKTRLPGHVSAAILYNQMLEMYDDRVSLPITSGMKIKVFNLKAPYGRFKSIALPTDAEFVPEWFLEHFTIDRKLHVEKLVDNPLQNILKAVGKKAPSITTLNVAAEWEF